MGVEDDFFLSGGHSLLALQLIHELNAAFGLDLPVRLLFAEPTVSGQAREIALALASQDQGRRVPFPPLVPLRPGGDKPPFFLVAGGWGGENELLVYARLARHLDSQRPYYGLRARGVDAGVHGSDSAAGAGDDGHGEGAKAELEFFIHYGIRIGARAFNDLSKLVPVSRCLRRERLGSRQRQIPLEFILLQCPEQYPSHGSAIRRKAAADG